MSRSLGLLAEFSGQAVRAQEPSSPAPAAADRNVLRTFVCLKQDYVDTLKSSRVTLDTQVVATFVRFESGFAVFKRPESLALIYIPKTAILYIGAKSSAPIKF